MVMFPQVKTIVRAARTDDRQNIANLIHFELNVHRHLDWRPPLDWLGYSPYLVVEQDQGVRAALACPPDPPEVAWIRLFAVSHQLSVARAWQLLWSEAHRQLLETPGAGWVAALPLHAWFEDLLAGSGFSKDHLVVMLNWTRGNLPPAIELSGVNTRPMNLDDLEAVARVDAVSFPPVWQNSRDGLELAFRQAAVATVAELDGRVVAYQISTGTGMGGHLARLAVAPQVQGRRIGYCLVRDMLSTFERRGAAHVSVNTQHDNLHSLALYGRCGFIRTGEEYPVYQLSLR